MADEISVAVLSDLHAFENVANPDDRPSFYCVNDDITDTPVGSLFSLIDAERLSADVVLCPGDLGHKASPAGIRDAWKRIHEIAEKLGASFVAGTVGNHDVDSRGSFNDFDLIGCLQQLKPLFPLPDEAQNDRFWSRHVALHAESGRFRLATLNTSAFHGYNEEFKHGRISDYTRECLRAAVAADSETYPVNILLCHHHPHKHSEYDLGEYDEMAGGQLLLEMLGSGDNGEWIVVHGHKHHPKLCYAHGSSSAPAIFSAGSLCHCLYPGLNTVAQRQFYILRFPLADISTYGLVGTFRAWDWELHKGWGRPSRRSGLPARGGFGYRCNHAQLARAAAQAIGGRTMAWEEFLSACPEVRYLIPGDLHQLLTSLTANHGIAVSYDAQESPAEIGATT